MGFDRFARFGSVLGRADWPEIRFALRAWLLAPVVEASLALRGARATIDWVDAWRPPARPRKGRRVTVPTGAIWVDRAYAVHLVRGRCLPRAIIQHALHRADGIPSRLVIGVKRPTEARLDAHAWVDDGRPGREEAAFAPILVTDAAGEMPT